MIDTFAAVLTGAGILLLAWAGFEAIRIWWSWRALRRRLAAVYERSPEEGP